MLRVAAWAVNPNAKDFKGTLLSVEDFAFDFSTLAAARRGARDTVSRGIMDLITAAPLLSPMRVGGKRSAVVHWHSYGRSRDLRFRSHCRAATYQEGGPPASFPGAACRLGADIP